MAKARRISKRRRQKRRPIPAKSSPPFSSSGKWIALIVVIGAVVAILGIYIFRDNQGRKFGKTPSSPGEERESSAEQPDLTPEEEVAALKEEEMALAQAVLADFPQAVGALEMMANLHSRHGRRAQALPLWQKCLEKNPRLLSVHRNLGNVAVDEGRYPEAIESFRKALEIAPKTPGLNQEIGHALIETGRYQEAIDQLQEELRISPKSVKTHFLTGQAYLELKQYLQAREHYEAAIQLSPEYSSAYYGLVRVYTGLKERDKARQYEEKFRNLRKNTKEQRHAGRMSVGWAATDLGAVRRSVVSALLDAEKLYLARRDIGKAEELLKRALAIDPNNTQSLERLGALYHMTNRSEAALRQFERISLIEPSNSYNYLNIGSISGKLGKYDEAAKAYAKAIEAAPQQSPGYRMLAQLYLTMGVKPVEAAKLAEKAVSIEASAGNLFVLAWASDVNGNRPQALKAIEEAIRLEPENSKYKQVYERIKSGN
ncbi:MAG: tetratricopeptide repeat protein [Planctomycetota bacterium]|jgi:tetratricopeptide (TPR) repeat protein